MGRRKEKRFILSERDGHILEFLWRWRIVTSAILLRRFFAGRTWKAGYYVLRQLEDAGYVVCIAVERGRHGWSLTKKGFDHIRPLLPEDASQNFRSESPAHDVLVTAVHLGSWNDLLPPEAELFTEQELRTTPVESYPSWVPKTELHRPDGYWKAKVKGKAWLIALEVELNQKRERHYQMVARFYKDRPQVFRVVWAVKRKSIATRLCKWLSEPPNGVPIHDFILISDFESMGWAAKFIAGCDEGCALNFLLNRDVWKHVENFQTLCKFDGRISPYDMDTSALPLSADDLNRLALEARLDSPNAFAAPSPKTTNGSSLVQEPLPKGSGGRKDEKPVGGPVHASGDGAASECIGQNHLLLGAPQLDSACESRKASSLPSDGGDGVVPQ